MRLASFASQGEEQGEGAGEASEAQAASTAARQLLDGPLLSDIVALHAAVFAALTPSSPAQHVQRASAGVPALAGQDLHCDVHALRAAFLQSYQMGAQVGAALCAESMQSALRPCTDSTPLHLDNPRTLAFNLALSSQLLTGLHLYVACI